MKSLNRKWLNSREHSRFLSMEAAYVDFNSQVFLGGEVPDIDAQMRD